MKKIILLISLLLTLSACTPSIDESNSQHMVNIVHELGETNVKINPKKVVIFDLGVLDMFDALNITVGAVPRNDLSPRLEVYNDDKYLNAGTLFEPDFEAIAEYSPDLIIISSRAAGEYDELSRIAPTIALSMDNSDFVGSLKLRLNTIAKLYPSKHDQIQVELSSLEQSINDLKEVVSLQQDETLFILTNGDTISVYGPGSRFGMVYDDFGFKPISNVTYDESTHGQQISFEFIAQHNPDNIIVMDRIVVTGDDKLSGSDLLTNELLEGVTAFKTNSVFYVDPFLWYVETGGLNSTKLMIEELSNIYK